MKIKKWNLDIIHSHTEFGVGTFARIIAKQFDIPLVHTYHTMYEDYIHYITKGYFLGPSKKIVEYLTLFYCDKTISELIVPTKKTYDLFKGKYRVSRNVHIIPTGIEISRFYKEEVNQKEVEEKRKELGIKDDDFIILYVGRLAKEKSIEVLIEGHKDIVRNKRNAKLLIIGDGPDIGLLKDLTRKLRIEDNVVFTGKVPWEQVPIYYQLASIFATASRTETQGLTVIEAMGASKPVVCADDESFKIAVVDGRNGYLFKDKKRYISSVLTLINDPEKVEKFGKQARIDAEPHSAKYFAEKVLSVYETAIKAKNRKKNSIINKIFKRRKNKEKTEDIL